MTMPDPALLCAVETLVQEVGRDQLAHFRSRPPGGGEEKEAREFVSRVDLASEQHLIEGLRKLLPGAGFYGEETGRQGSQARVWVIDPLDGTTNYLSGLDQFSISVALLEAGKPVLGVVHRPASGECFSALAGGPLTHDGREPPPVPPELPLSAALLGTGFPYRSPDLAEAFFPCAREVLYQCRGIRRMGSAALDLSYVAAGYLQGFWESDLQPYDVAAGLLFLEARGALVTNGRGQAYDMFRDRLLVCGWPRVHAAMLPVVERHYRLA